MIFSHKQHLPSRLRLDIDHSILSSFMVRHFHHFYTSLPRSFWVTVTLTQLMRWFVMRMRVFQPTIKISSFFTGQWTLLIKLQKSAINFCLQPFLKFMITKDENHSVYTYTRSSAGYVAREENEIASCFGSNKGGWFNPPITLTCENGCCNPLIVL